jgi:hypothetical protein
MPFRDFNCFEGIFFGMYFLEGPKSAMDVLITSLMYDNALNRQVVVCYAEKPYQMLLKWMKALHADA